MTITGRFDKQGFRELLHSLIPAELRETLEVRTSTYVRVRALAAMLWVVTIISFVSTLGVIIHHVLNHREMLKYDIASSFIVLLFMLQTWMFYKYQNYWVSGLAFTNFYFLLIAILVVLGGGYDSPGRVALLTCPFVSFLIGGHQEGIQNTLIVMLFGLGLMLLKSIGFDLPDLFAEEAHHFRFSIYWAVTIVIISSCIVVYETGLMDRDDLAGVLDRD